MLTIPTDVLTAMRLLARKASSTRSRGPGPPVLILPAPDALTLVVRRDEVTVASTVATSCSTRESELLPGEVLDRIDGSSAEPVVIEADGPHRLRARWSHRGELRTETVDRHRPGPHDQLPARPTEMSPVPPAFLTALHEAGRTTARRPNPRFAFHRVQVRGSAGQVIGTDGQLAYRHAGFRLPFADDLLVPAVPLFGAKELQASVPVSVGRTATHLVVTAGPWTVFLAIDATARYPDLAGVIPKRLRPAAVIAFTEREATDVRTVLSDGDPTERPVELTWSVTDPPVVRVPTGESGFGREVRLSRTGVADRPGRVRVGTAFLVRAFALGLTTVKIAAPDKPVLAVGGDVTLVALPHTPDDEEDVEVERSAMKRPPGSVAVDAVESPVVATERPEPIDPLLEVEGLRAVLTEAVQRATRLLAVLRGKKKEQKALTGVWASLKALALDREGGR